MSDQLAPQRERFSNGVFLRLRRDSRVPPVSWVRTLVVSVSGACTPDPPPKFHVGEILRRMEGIPIRDWPSFPETPIS
jgi:hypothetical protein